MIRFFKSAGARLTPLTDAEPGCWVSVVDPSEEEVALLVDRLGVQNDFVRAALDEEEMSRVETDEEQTLLLFDVPVAMNGEDNTVVYSTFPVAAIVTEDYFVTVSLREVAVLRDFFEGTAKACSTSFRSRLFLLVMLRVAGKYMQYLKQIDKISGHIENQLHRAMKNKELIQLMDLQKSLVYFSTSLKATETTLEKIMRGRVLKLYEEDQDILEDVIVEFKQAIEMADIYQSILTGTMDAFASVISNNLNIVMKTLTLITIMMTIPTIVFSYYGMNVEGMPLTNAWFPVLFSVVLTVAVTFVLKKKKLF